MGAAVLDVELTTVPATTSTAPHTEAFVVVRHEGQVVGALRLPCPDRVLTREALASAVGSTPDVVRRIADRTVLARLDPDRAEQPIPSSWTVAVCTRDRPEALRRCVKSILDLADRPPQVVVVENATSTPEAREIAEELGVQYELEPVPGLNRARRRAAAAAEGEHLLFTDDDVVVDPGWARGLLTELAGARVGAATGLTMPLELETHWQDLFEHRGGFGRGFDRLVADRAEFRSIAAGRLGAGASMGFRRSAIDELGLFDADIDCGTVARSGGDAYGLYLLLRGGYRAVYTPAALAWHQHRSDERSLRSTLEGYSTGVFTWQLHALFAQRDVSALRAIVERLWQHHGRTLLASARRAPHALPWSMAVAELRAALDAPAAYWKTR